jgi:hypothetical protein
LKNKYKNSGKPPHAKSHFSIEKKSKNSNSMPHHFSPLKNNSKNLRKSPHPMSHLSIGKNSKKL